MEEKNADIIIILSIVVAFGLAVSLTTDSLGIFVIGIPASVILYRLWSRSQSHYESKTVESLPGQQLKARRRYTSSCALVLLEMLTLNLGAAFAQDNASRIFRCTAKDAVGVQNNGTLDKSDPGVKISRRHFDQMVISVPKGRVTYPDTGVWEERVVERTSVADDYVLVPSLYFRRYHTAANATTDFIRLRTATGEPHVTFTAFRMSYLVTGTCDIVP